MKRVIEISAGEGGKDSQLFVGDLVNAYERMATIFNWSVD